MANISGKSKNYISDFHFCMSRYSRVATYFVCLELECLGVHIPLFISPLLGRGAQFKCSVIYGQNIRKVYKKYMSAFHMRLRKYSRGSTYFVCLKWYCLGVYILCLLLLLPQLVLRH
jgi:hypothetical protein